MSESTEMTDPVDAAVSRAIVVEFPEGIKITQAILTGHLEDRGIP